MTDPPKYQPVMDRKSLKFTFKVGNTVGNKKRKVRPIDLTP
jgi:hypothetical protein